MALVDVKYVVTVEFYNDVDLIDSMAFYVTGATYAAALVRSFEQSGVIWVVSAQAPTVGSLVECRVRRAIYAGV